MLRPALLPGGWLPATLAPGAGRDMLRAALLVLWPTVSPCALLPLLLCAAPAAPLTRLLPAVAAAVERWPCFMLLAGSTAAGRCWEASDTSRLDASLLMLCERGVGPHMSCAAWRRSQNSGAAGTPAAAEPGNDTAACRRLIRLMAIPGLAGGSDSLSAATAGTHTSLR